jgi:hypothetical protein
MIKELIERKRKEALESLSDLSKELQHQAALYEKECDAWWDALPYQDKQKAFYSICKRIRLGEIFENRSYRGMIYDVFKFGPEGYGLGMECGYQDIHNAIYTEEELKEEIDKRKKQDDDHK